MLLFFLIFFGGGAVEGLLFVFSGTLQGLHGEALWCQCSDGARGDTKVNAAS